MQRWLPCVPQLLPRLHHLGLLDERVGHSAGRDQYVATRAPCRRLWLRILLLFWIYLTNITLTLQVLYHLLAVAVAWSAWSSRSGDPTAIPCLAKSTWLLQSVCLHASFFVFVTHWVLVCPLGDCRLKVVSYFTHGVNFVIMVTDVYLSGQPLLLPHAFCTFGYVLLYIAWTIVHYAGHLTNEKGDRYIYKDLDWSQAGSTATLSAGIFFIVTPLVVLGCWTIMRCRTKRNGLAGMETHKVMHVPQP